MSNAFDRNTEDAVREFQRVFNLDADGIVGKATWYKIKEVWTGVKQLSELASEGLTLTEVQPAFPEVLRYGDQGVAVTTVQYYLAFLGYFLPELPQLALTGVFDDDTRDAVYTFQNAYGLPVDGVVGRTTWTEVYDQFLRLTGVKIHEGFGQSETTPLLMTSKWMEPKTGSTGRPSPAYDIALVDENGQDVDDGVEGEIVIRLDKGHPAGLFLGYYRNQEQTDAVFYNGMYHTGDMAWRDVDGYFNFIGRGDDVIKSSGYRIGPFEVESALLEHPAVLETAITAAPDELRGQVVKASIVLVKGTEGTDALKKEIQTYVKTHTAPYKYPRIVEFRKALPKTTSGKIIRSKL